MSSITKRVKELGGEIDTAILRFSIMWNEGILLDDNDLDAHCKEPNENIIYYSNKESAETCGKLDIDVVNPSNYYKSAVENIYYTDKNHMLTGEYEFSVKCFSFEGGTGGFRAEIFMDGETHYFKHDKPLEGKEIVVVAVVTLHDDGHFSIDKKI